MQNFNPWVCLYDDFTNYKVEFTYFLLLYCKPCTLNREKALILIFFFWYKKAKSKCLLVLPYQKSDAHIANQNDWINGSSTDLAGWCVL